MPSRSTGGQTAAFGLFALAVAAAFGLLFATPASPLDQESWDETAPNLAGTPGSGGTVPTIPGMSATILAGPSPGSTPKPPPTPKPTATPVPTPDPKKLTKEDYACQKIQQAAKDLNDAIETKRKLGLPLPFGIELPGEQQYRDAYDKAVAELKASNPKATAKELDEAGKKAGREAVEDAIKNGEIVDPNTGETYGDVYRREWEGVNRGKPVPPPGASSVPPGASQYMKDCAAAGVPLPPPWGDPRWVNQGELPDKNNFAGGDKRYTEVWTTKTPGGICYALPRRKDNASDPIELLGQICQSSATGKACFWDNVGLDGKRVTGDKTNGVDPSKLQGGDKLEENCTACHRGDNVFIIHPGTPLDQPGSNPCTGGGKSPTEQNTSKPYQPIGRPGRGPGDDGGFKNDPRTTPLPSGQGNGCTSCHTIPPVTQRYCGLIRGFVESGEMPPGGGLDENEKKDVEALKAECNKLAKKESDKWK